MTFAFEYVGVRFDPEFEHHRFFGRILFGEICTGNQVIVPTHAGERIGIVATFWDDMYNWSAMPFYHAVSKEAVSEPFCLCVHGLAAKAELPCPGVVRAPPPA